MPKVSNLAIRKVDGTDHDYYPTWTFSDEHLSHYEIMWAYATGNKSNGQLDWFHGSDATTYGVPNAYDSNAIYSPPENAIQFRVQVRPVSQTYKVNDKDTYYWIGEWVMRVETENPANATPEAPGAPTVEIDGTSMTVSLTDITAPDLDRTLAFIEIYKDGKLYKTAEIKIQVDGSVSYKCTIDIGGEYRARCKLGGFGNNGIVVFWSDWGPFSSVTGTAPSSPYGISTIRAASSTSVFLSWASVSSADSYDIEYTTNPANFEGSNATTTLTGIETTQYTITGLESGDEYYFRIRAVNENGESDWTAYKSVIVGRVPAAPTTWSSATTVVVGDPLNLYWVHNSEDGSWESYAQLEIYFDDFKETHTIKSDQIEDEEGTEQEKTYSYSVDTTDYPEGTRIKWRVRTSGITNEFGDWSIQRVVDIYAQPTLSLNVTDQNGVPFDILSSFPFHIECFAGPKTQEPIGYHVSITTLATYETVDSIGEKVYVTAGTPVYSKYFDTNNELSLTISANDVDLENGQYYSISVIVSMNSGLTAESTRPFSVSWTEESYEPNIELSVDYDTYTTYVTPYCRDAEGNAVQGITLSLYRKDFDGGFTEIATGLDPNLSTVVTDPHPALDYARYRVIATSVSTGAVSYYDPPAYPIDGQEVVLQWDEEWRALNVTSPDPLLDPLWTGSILKLPWNIDISDSDSREVTLVNYIGRTYPVSYYGTFVDSSSTWNVELDATDAETVYALRRLSKWAGDVYVREPSGTGYWANVQVSFSKKHKDLVIPVTFKITRVEGGM